MFLNVSDTDRSMERLVNLFYTQALQSLCHSADKDYPDHRLPVPVRFILDDFAASAEIPDFDKIISVIRSREIYVSVILQSPSQLNAIYGHNRAMTLINNCLYLGGQDVDTVKYISYKANKTVDSVLNLPWATPTCSPAALCPGRSRSSTCAATSSIVSSRRLPGGVFSQQPSRRQRDRPSLPWAVPGIPAKACILGPALMAGRSKGFSHSMNAQPNQLGPMEGEGNG